MEPRHATPEEHLKAIYNCATQVVWDKVSTCLLHGIWLCLCLLSKAAEPVRGRPTFKVGVRRIRDPFLARKPDKSCNFSRGLIVTISLQVAGRSDTGQQTDFGILCVCARVDSRLVGQLRHGWYDAQTMCKHQGLPSHGPRDMHCIQYGTA